ncbi:MAG: hypothetical protein ACTHJR_06265 [Sphingomonas sp.]|uniref:hypothetical protein n=1 Tax=Sphingomonas sp. TaxID=28214 RepID=UPI003F806510
MNKFLTKAVLGTTLAATTLAVAAPADAQRYRRWHHDDDTGAAIAGGIVGLALGAAIASSSDNDRYYRDRWYRDHGYRYNYDDYYYRQRGYYPTDGYYAYRYRDYRSCRIERRYDPYYGRSVRVRVCY